MKTPTTGYFIPQHEVAVLKKRWPPLFGQPYPFGDFIPFEEDSEDLTRLPRVREIDVLGRLTDKIGLEILVVSVGGTAEKDEKTPWFIPWSINKTQFTPLFFFHAIGQRLGPKMQFDRTRAKYEYKHIANLIDCSAAQYKGIYWEPFAQAYRFQAIPAIHRGKGDIDLHPMLVSNGGPAKLKVIDGGRSDHPKPPKGAA